MKSHSQADSPSRSFSPNLGSWALLASIFIVTAGISFILGGRLSALGLHPMQDFWFGADTWRVFENLTSRFGNHYRTSVHPLSSLLLSTPTIALIKLGYSPELSARLLIAVGAGLLTTTFFSLCLRMTHRTLDALIYTTLLTSSASFLFFATIFELYVWGAVSILVAIMSGTVSGYFRPLALVIGSAVSLSFTVTNWMAGLAVAAATEPIKRAALYTALAFAAVAALTAVQSNVYINSGKFLYFGEEPRYANLDPREKLAIAPRAFLLDPIFFPGLATVDEEAEDGNLHVPGLGQSKRTASSPLGSAAVVLWMALVCAGTYGAWSTRRTQRGVVHMPFIVVAVIAGQFVLHLFYGSGWFMYSLHYAPLLVLLASFSSLTTFRFACLAMACLLIALAAWNNLSGLEQSTGLIEAHL